ncbi:hypothetical protein [Gordonibacter sp.]|uniref:hypothetical protein n=1 Tax=Gordonibacter sp. TaxID=1968902 RepID=UPI002FC825D7
MKKRLRSKALSIWVAALALAMALALGACAPNSAAPEGDGAPASNDSAEKGEYTKYDPAVEAEHTGGKAIEGSEEEELQQERIAGGSVGAVTSKNLEPLVGITDSSAGDYVPTYGIDGQPPAMGHGDNGSDCLSCHAPGKSGAGQPPSHEKAKLGNGDCMSCHAAKGK